jgi:hypothetical protein
VVRHREAITPSSFAKVEGQEEGRGIGLQPYTVMEIYGRLKASFREYRQLRASRKPILAVQRTIIFYAGWLGHYVADGSQPLHTTIQYNGWVGSNPNGYTTEHGIHSQFESTYVAVNITEKNFAGLVGFTFCWHKHALAQPA